jgi:hypothetical protein
MCARLLIHLNEHNAHDIYVTNGQRYLPFAVITIPSLFSLMTYHLLCNKRNTMGATNGTGTGNPSGAPEFNHCFSGVRVTQSFVFCVYICLCLFYFDHCLSFFDLRVICYYPFSIFKLFLSISLMWFFNNNKRIVISSIRQAKISNPQRTSVNLTWKEMQWTIPQIRYESAYRWKRQTNRERIHSLSCIGLVWQKKNSFYFC